MRSKNTGDRNTGHSNSGSYNTGNYNVGRCNAGDFNRGDRNAGDRNAGDRNSGNWNSGAFNTGAYNIGHSNSGHGNTGHGNTGNFNTGSWNTGNKNNGYFNRDNPKMIRVFEKECPCEIWENAFKPAWLNFPLTKWIALKDMTDEEKEDNPHCKTTNGYLKALNYKEAFQASYKAASREEQLKVKELPNFDPDIFFEISGIRIDEEDSSASLRMNMNELESVLEKLKKKLQ